MPILMDRHDMRGATAENVADAHRRDLEIQDKYGQVHDLLVRRGARHRLLPRRILMPQQPRNVTVRRMGRSRQKSSPSISRLKRPSLAALTILAHAPDATAPEMGAGLRAVMFTDIVGSTEMTARLGDAAALELVRVHNALVRRGLALHHGREVKHTGDGIMAVFDEVAELDPLQPTSNGALRRTTPKRPRLEGADKHSRW